MIGIRKSRETLYALYGAVPTEKRKARRERAGKSEGNEGEHGLLFFVWKI